MMGAVAGDMKQGEQAGEDNTGWADGSWQTGLGVLEGCDQRPHSRGSDLDLSQYRKCRNSELKYTISTLHFLVINKHNLNVT